MLTGFLPHGDVQYYLFLRSCYSQFLGIWGIADEGHQPHSAPRHADNSKQHLAKMSKGEKHSPLTHTHTKTTFNVAGKDTPHHHSPLPHTPHHPPPPPPHPPLARPIHIQPTEHS